MNFIENLLTQAGLVRNKTFKETRFTKIPSSDFAVWGDSIETDGSDYENLIVRHSSTIEVYTYRPQSEVLKKILSTLWHEGIKHSVSERIWIGDDQIYLTYIYLDWCE